MNESEWLTSTDPAKMLRAMSPGPGEVGFIERGRLGELAYRPSPRKLRLFACACCRSAGRGDDEVDRWEAAGDPFGMPDYQWAAAWAGDNAPEVPHLDRAALLRSIVGNPWRSVTTVTRGGRFCHPTPWLTPTVVHLAQTIYDERRWDALPILADALEEAGCQHVVCPACNGDGGFQANSTWVPCELCGEADAALLGKDPFSLLAALRGPGPWCRGFWALDLLLNKD